MNNESQSRSGKATRDFSLEAAAQWWLRLRGTQDPRTATDWLQWSGEKVEHAEAFERVVELGTQLSSLDASTKEALIAEFAPRDSIPIRKAQWRRPALLATAAAVAAMLVGAGGYLAWFQAAPVSEQTFTTQIGENRSLVLDDGSKVALGGASKIEVRYSEHLREIRLEKGEAYFVDTHEPGRPFVVTAGEISAQAIGTAFDVRRSAGNIVVAVADGRVLVASGYARPTNSSAVEASAGQQVVYSTTAAGLEISTIDANNIAAWRQRRLEFFDEPLSSVISQLNRYSQKPIRIDSSSLNTLRLTGTAYLDNLNGWLSAVPALFPIKVTTGSDVIVLTSSDTHAQRR